jgi:transketolase
MMSSPIIFPAAIASCRRTFKCVLRWSRRRPLGWERYVGRADCVIGMKTFGPSAPLKELQRKFGFEPDQVVTVVKDLLSRSQRRHASVAA